MKYYEERLAKLYQGDCRRMADLPDETVQCVTTSPPFWGLRKYEGDQDLIWGDSDCEHEWAAEMIKRGHHAGETNPGKEYYTKDAGQWSNSQGCFCLKCGAWKGAFGLEPTPELYVQHTVEIMREVWRVLRKDGVVFYNIGDSYASGKGTCFNPGGGKGSFSGHGNRKDAGAYPLDRGNVSMLRASGLKPKDLCLIPFHIAIALRSDGWYIRSVIIWNKPNPMPESVKDRPTSTYEFILMLTKSGTTQYWTHRDKGGRRTRPGPDYRWIKQVSNIRGLKTKGDQEVSDPEQNHGLDIAPQNIVEEVAIKPDGWTRENKMGWDRINLWEGHDYYWDADAVRESYQPSSLERIKYPLTGSKQGEKSWAVNNANWADRFSSAGRNLRDVWTFPTKGWPEAHFAVFPEKLPELCIKAATSEKGCCPKCGAPWVRVIEKDIEAQMGYGNMGAKGSKWMDEGKQSSGHRIQKNMNALRAVGRDHDNPFPIRETVGWRPSCSCGLEPIPCIVVDNFAGAGTTLLAAKKLGRSSIGYEISEKYCAMIENRIKAVML